MKYGRVAFITTPRFRDESPKELRSFVFEHLYSLCHSFTVLTTGGTFERLKKLLNEPLEAGTRYESDHRSLVKDEPSLEKWRAVISAGLEPTYSGFGGMIHISYELVEQRLDAVIHLMDWKDKSAKPDSAVLSREANVHDVPIATDLETAKAYVRSWNAFLSQNKTGGPKLFRHRVPLESLPLEGLKDGSRGIAMVAHDNMKLEMCCFAVRHASHIFRDFQYVLATGTTGGWLKKFMEAADHREDAAKIRLCFSGPKGGDLQIAYAVVRGWCQKVVFLQDPSVSHAHDSDIRLFEQAVSSKGVRVELATNVESARFLIGP